ncbi:MAG: PQQ-binding-like beta-propeller repeat protein [bacterium]|nr:PQQ-binding-like beta-propeller repeat protein [bacterium]
MKRFAPLLVLSLLVAATAVAADGDLVTQGLIGDWVFARDRVDGHTLDSKRGPDAEIVGKKKFAKNPESLRLDGNKTHVSISEKLEDTRLPEGPMTAEAWVLIDQAAPWGGILGAFQDNGGFEKGWTLGYKDSSFSFGLSSKGADDGDGRMTYLTASVPFDLGQWYHVVGVYDGVDMQIYVNGKLRGTADDQSGPILYPDHAFFDIGAYHDDDEFFRCEGRVMQVRLYKRALTADDIEDNFLARPGLFPEKVQVALGPWLQFTAPDAALIRWRTHEPAPSVVEYVIGDDTLRREDATPKTDHEIAIDGLRRNEVHYYRIVIPSSGSEARTEDFECDTAFNYTLPPLPDRPSPYPSDALAPVYTAAADRIAAAGPKGGGYCVVLGCAEGRLAYELAKRTQLFIIGMDTDAEAVQSGRKALKAAGVYGHRVTLRTVESYDALPFSEYFANLIASDRMLTEGACPVPAAEVARILHPLGGVACLGAPGAAPAKPASTDIAAWLGDSGMKCALSEESGVWALLSRAAVEGAGSWTHQYGRPDNSARSGETLMGATRTDALQVQWLGRPGSRAMVDRNPRVPAPLFADGRLFTQGLHRLIAQDAYNGAILWSLEIPSIERFNMPRDASNWCTDGRFVYAAVGDACWLIDAATGALAHVLESDQDAGARDWGYIAQAGDILFGSTVKTESVYTNYWGAAQAGWYDNRVGPVTFKVCSDSLFALDKETLKRTWVYKGGTVINTTIVVAEPSRDLPRRLYFVESRHPKVAAAGTGRIGMKELWQDQFLVALDAQTGTKLWEQPLDTIDGTVVFYLVHAKDTLFIALSDDKYHLYAFEDTNGAPRWHATHDWTGGDHSGHMQHPAVVADTIFLEPCGYDIATGKRVTEAMGRHEGCATYAATEHALVYRGSGRQIAMWDPDTGDVTAWTRLRPGCWLTTVAGGGMILSPEGGGGCSCGGWMETSLAFAPRGK